MVPNCVMMGKTFKQHIEAISSGHLSKDLTAERDRKTRTDGAAERAERAERVERGKKSQGRRGDRPERRL